MPEGAWKRIAVRAQGQSHLVRASRASLVMCVSPPRDGGSASAAERLPFQENVEERSSEPRILQEVSWEVTPMQITVALRGRTRLAALLRDSEQEADHKDRGHRCDRRNRRTWRPMFLGVLVARSTRLVALGRVVAPQRRVGSVQAAAMAVTYFLQTARVPVPTLSTRLLEAAVRRLDPEHRVTYRGKVLLVLDPTEYEKRSRERGKCGRQMEHSGRVRRAKSRPTPKRSTGRAQTQDGSGPAPKEERRTATAPGYVDIWAGLVLKGKRFLPLARQHSPSRHPQCTSHNAVEEAVSINRELGQTAELALSLSILGAAAHERRDLRRATALLEEAAALAEEVGDSWQVAWNLHNLSDVALQEGDVARASSLSCNGLTRARDIGDSVAVLICLSQLAIVAKRRGQVRRAGALWGAAERLDEELGETLWRATRPQAEETLGDRVPDFELGVEEGRRLELEDAISLALRP